jgi:hypothetical protein
MTPPRVVWKVTSMVRLVAPLIRPAGRVVGLLPLKVSAWPAMTVWPGPVVDCHRKLYPGAVPETLGSVETVVSEIGPSAGVPVVGAPWIA